MNGYLVWGANIHFRINRFLIILTSKMQWLLIVTDIVNDLYFKNNQNVKLQNFLIYYHSQKWK